MCSYEDYLECQKSKVNKLISENVNGLNWELKNLKKAKTKHINTLLKYVPVEEVEKSGVLVVGARFGSDIELLEKAGYKDVEGIDIYDPPLHPRIQYCDAHELSKLKKQYSLIYLYHVMEHLLYPTKVIKEIRKSLLFGGIVSVVVPPLNRKKAIDAQTEFHSYRELQYAFVHNKFSIIYTKFVSNTMQTAFRKK